MEVLVNELRRVFPDKKVVPAVKVGDHFQPIEWAYMKVTGKKIRFISFYLTSRGIKVLKSKSSYSIYFWINNQRFRVSDHPTNHGEGIDHQFLVKYDTCVVQLIAAIKLAHFKPDAYYG